MGAQALSDELLAANADIAKHFDEEQELVKTVLREASQKLMPIVGEIKALSAQVGERVAPSGRDRHRCVPSSAPAPGSTFPRAGLTAATCQVVWCGSNGRIGATT